MVCFAELGVLLDAEIDGIWNGGFDGFCRNKNLCKNKKWKISVEEWGRGERWGVHTLGIESYALDLVFEWIKSYKNIDFWIKLPIYTEILWNPS